MSGDHHRRPLAEIRDQRDAAELNLLGVRQENARLRDRVHALETVLAELGDWVSDNHGCHVPNEYEGCAFCEEIHAQIRVALAPGPRAGGE